MRLILVFIAIQSLICYPTKADPGPGLKFVKNKTQWSNQVHFNIKVPGGTMSIQPGSFLYSFLDERKLKDLHEQTHGINKEASDLAQLNVLINGQFIQTNFIESNSKSIPTPFGESREYYNFFLGNDSSRWSTDVRAYEGVVYPCFYPGIDLKLYSKGENLKYDFIVSPGAAVSAIKFEYKGADDVYIKNGDLYVHSALADIIEKRPVVYQVIGNTKLFIKCSYELDSGKISFCLEESYDPCYDLVIDPLLIFSTYSGFSADNWGSAATPGENGKLYTT